MGFEKARRPIIASVNNQPVLIDPKNYSLTEQDTGMKWLDGSTVYEKTVAIPAGPNNNTVNTAHGITGIAELVSFTGQIKNSSPLWITLPHDSGNAAGGGVGVNVDSTNVSLNAIIDLSAFSGYVTLRYTKS